jgi:hypothetical protein
MSRHLAHFPQCVADMERSGKDRGDRGRLRQHRKKSCPVSTKHITQFDYSNDVNLTEHQSNQVHHRRSSRRTIFASAAASHSMIGEDGSVPSCPEKMMCLLM